MHPMLIADLMKLNEEDRYAHYDTTIALSPAQKPLESSEIKPC